VAAAGELSGASGQQAGGLAGKTEMERLGSRGMRYRSPPPRGEVETESPGNEGARREALKVEPVRPHFVKRRRKGAGMEPGR
jgi:hypothetical protein